MTSEWLTHRDQVREETRNRYRSELSTCDEVFDDLLSAPERHRLDFRTKPQKAAHFLALKAIKTAQSIVTAFENGYYEDAYSQLRPLCETTINAVFIHCDDQQIESRGTEFTDHAARSFSQMEGFRQQYFPELGGSSVAYRERLASDLATLPRGVNQLDWTPLSIQQRIEAIENFCDTDQEKSMYRFIWALYKDTCKALHPDIASFRLYIRRGSDDLRWTWRAEVPPNSIPLQIAVTNLVVTFLAVSKSIGPALQTDCEKLAAKVAAALSTTRAT